MKKFIALAILAMIALPSTTMAKKVTIQNVTREKRFDIDVHNLSIWYQGEVSLGFATTGKATGNDDGHSYKVNSDFSRPFIETVHGVRLTKYAFVGLGLGLQYAYGKCSTDSYYDNYYDEYYTDDSKWNTLLMPVFVNLKGYYPVNDDFAPYLTTSFGVSPILMSDLSYTNGSYETKHKGGFYCKLGVGLNYKKFIFDFGLMHQGMANKDYYNGNDNGKVKISTNSFYANIGFLF